jgi:3-oxoacyl-[acyl-carrier protein] reductase
MQYGFATMDLQLDGKVALVTGSSKGIGKGIAMTLAREGATVTVHGRDAAEAEHVRHAIVKAGGRAHVVLADVTSDTEVASMVDEARHGVGDVEILVNNAGGSAADQDWSMTGAESWAAAYDRNVLAAVRVTTGFLPRMRARRWGRVINISSLAGIMPPPHNPDYAAAKAAILAMTVSMAKAVAADGITVNTVSPGTIRSAKLEAKFRETAAKRGVSGGAPWEDVEQAVLSDFAQVPTGRVGTLEEIADAVAFLVSPRAGYITGSNIRLDGGMMPTI